MDSVTTGSLLVHIKAPSPRWAKPRFPAPFHQRKRCVAFEMLEIGNKPALSMGWVVGSLPPEREGEEVCDPSSVTPLSVR